MRMIDIQAKQAEINGMNYGDARVLDLQMLYFGDEVHLYIEDYIGYEENTEECWKLTFSLCSQVTYSTDANVRTAWNVNTFSYKDLYYDCHDINVQSVDGEMIECLIDLQGFIMIDIFCRDITIEKVKLADQHFFWQENKD